jgi:hypothetical protein
MANKVLETRSKKLGTAIANKQKDVDESKQGGIGQFASDFVAGGVGQAVEDFGSGQIGKGIKHIYQHQGMRTIREGRAAKGDMAAHDIAQMTAQQRQIEEQSATLKGLHEIFKSGTINVNVVNKPTGNTGKGPPGAAPPQSSGLTPTE